MTKTQIILLVLTVTIAHVLGNCYSKKIHIKNGKSGSFSCKKGFALRGIHRGSADNLSGINHLYCCKLPKIGSQKRYSSNWARSFDNKGWSNCKGTGFMTGFQKSRGVNIYNLEHANCVKNKYTPSSHCYTETSVVIALDRRNSWAYCRRNGYFMKGMWRNINRKNDKNAHKLHRIEYFNCCKPTVILPKKAPRQGRCTGWGDIHFSTPWSKRMIDNQATGSLKFSKTKYFQVDVQSSTWSKNRGKTATSVGTAVVFVVKSTKGVKTIVGFNGSKYIVNGKSKSYRQAVRILKKKGVRTYKQNSRTVIFRVKNEFLQVATYKVGNRVSRKKQGLATQYMTISVNGFHYYYGLCSLVTKPSYLIKNHFKKVTIIKNHYNKCHKKAHTIAVKVCKNIRSQERRKACIFDKCVGLSAKIAVQNSRAITKFTKFISQWKKLQKSHSKKALHFNRLLKAAHKKKRAHQKAKNAHVKASKKHLSIVNKHTKIYKQYGKKVHKYHKLIRHVQKLIRKYQSKANQHYRASRHYKSLVYQLAILKKYYKSDKLKSLKRYFQYKKMAKKHKIYASKHSKSAKYHLKKIKSASSKVKKHLKSYRKHLKYAKHYGIHSNAAAKKINAIRKSNKNKVKVHKITRHTK